jgi:hypothetical protein
MKADTIVKLIASIFTLLSCGNKYIEAGLKVLVLGAVALSVSLLAVDSISGDLTTIIEYLRSLISPAEVVTIDAIAAPLPALDIPTVE